MIYYKFSSMSRITLLLLSVLSINVAGQTENLSKLSIDQIMQGEDFVGYLPEEVRWSDDSRSLFFSWNPDHDTLRSTYRADVASGKIEKLSFGQQKSVTTRGVYTKDHRWKVYEKQGDIFQLNTSTMEITRITGTLASETNPRYSGNGSSVIFQQEMNLFQWSRDDGSITQLTDFRKGNKEETVTTPQDQWLENDQMAWFDILKKRKERENAAAFRNSQAQFERPETIYLGNKRLNDLTISPDLRYVVYQLFIDAEDKNTIVADYVNRSGYTTDITSRAKVGAPRNHFESWILDLQKDTTYRIETKDIKGIYDKPAYLKAYAKDTGTYCDRFEDPREVRIAPPLFSENGSAVVNVTSLDYKDRWIMLLDLPGGTLKLIDRQHDDAWIGGPGIGWESDGVVEWIDNETIWFKSEKTGFSHLYTANVKNGKIRALTGGEFEVLDVQLSRDKKRFYLTTNEVSPHENHFYHMDVSGGKRVQITSQKGGHRVIVSPDEKQLAILFSYANQPWELYVMPNKPGAQMVRLTRSTTAEFNAYPWIDPEIIHFTARDGVKVPASLYKPSPGKKNGAAVVFVHGAGYLQNVHHWWPSYYREYMFHNLLVDNGYTVLAIDFRASAGYGRDWRTAIYRHMGGKDLEDQVDGAAYLVEQQGIDRKRIGIYGGSYGGFITLMAMFKSPGTFTCGAALRSVTDWAHYSHNYTANILNTPVEDSLAYAQSSPIYYAEGLEGKLLMLHGVMDTNVHFQDVVRLSQRLIELKKENWELALFPLEGHGFIEPSSWSDEYRRIFHLFQETLRE